MLVSRYLQLAGSLGLAATLASVYSSPLYAGSWGLEDWGTMVWGAEHAVPALPAAGMLLLAGLIILTTLRYGAKRVAPFLFVMFVPLIAVSVPNIFSNGTIADADEVNANFVAVEDSVNTLRPTILANIINPVSPVFISGNNIWQTMPGLTTSINLVESQIVMIDYQIAVGQSGGGYLVTRLKIDSTVQPDTITTTSGAYVSNRASWAGQLGPGSHTLTVEYRANTSTNSVISGSDFQGVSLRALSLGAP